jgi:hypothetical protein
LKASIGFHAILFDCNVNTVLCIGEEVLRSNRRTALSVALAANKLVSVWLKLTFLIVSTPVGQLNVSVALPPLRCISYKYIDEPPETAKEGKFLCIEIPVRPVGESHDAVGGLPVCVLYGSDISARYYLPFSCPAYTLDHVLMILGLPYFFSTWEIPYFDNAVSRGACEMVQ